MTTGGAAFCRSLPFTAAPVDNFEALKLYAPLATLAGAAYAFVRGAFSYVWRLAAVERQTAENTTAIERLEGPLTSLTLSVARIEEHVKRGAK